MALSVLFFAGLREKVGYPQQSVDWPISADSLVVRELIDHLPEHISPILDIPNLRCAINHEMVSLDTALHDGDEVAFFPPVTGG